MSYKAIGHSYSLSSPRADSSRQAASTRGFLSTVQLHIAPYELLEIARHVRLLLQVGQKVALVGAELDDLAYHVRLVVAHRCPFLCVARCHDLLLSAACGRW